MRKLLLTTILGASILGGSNLIASANDRQAIRDTKANTLEQLQETITQVTGKAEISQEDLELIKEQLSSAIKENEPQIGSNVQQVGVWLELMEANKQIEEFGSYIDSIDLEQYQPMSADELRELGIE